MNETALVKTTHILGASLLIAGTCVGGGMLALPVETGVAGFFPSLLIMLISWSFMTMTGLLLIEANLWMEEGAHLMTMSSRLLGHFGKYLSFVLYLFMGYGSLVAYNSGGATLIESAIRNFTHFDPTRAQSCTLFAIIFGSLLYLGTKRIGRINAVLVTGMVVAYFGMIVMGSGGVKVSLLSFRNFSESFWAVPLILTTFSYQMIVPSLTPYLKRDPEALRKAVILGTSIPFVIYGIWQWIVLGTVPVAGSGGLEEALNQGVTATQALRSFVSSPYLSVTAEFFAFFALVTSYLGIALGMFDFIADSFKIRTVGLGKLSIGLLIIIPSLFFAAIYPRAFLIALDVTGGFGDTILSGLLPISMIWVGRYIKRIEGPYKVAGEKKSLVTLAAFAILVIAIQIIKLAGE